MTEQRLVSLPRPNLTQKLHLNDIQIAREQILLTCLAGFQRARRLRRVRPFGRRREKPCEQRWIRQGKGRREKDLWYLEGHRVHGGVDWCCDCSVGAGRGLHTHIL